MNNRSLFERFNKIAGKEGKWLSLREKELTPAEKQAAIDSASLGKRLGGDNKNIKAKRDRKDLQPMSNKALKIKQQDAMQAVADTEKLSGRGSPAAKSAAKTTANELGITKKKGILYPPEGEFKPVGVEGEPVPEYTGGRPMIRQSARSVSEPRVAAPIEEVNHEILESRAEKLAYLRNLDFNPNSPGNSIQDRGNKPHQHVTGIDSADLFPEFSSPYLQKVNELIKQYITSENAGEYYEEFPFVDADNIPDPPHAGLYRDSDSTQFDPENYDSISQIMNMMDEDPKIGTVGKYPYMYPRERDTLFDKYEGQDVSAEDIVKNSRKHEIPQEHLDQSWGELNRVQKDFFKNTGHGIGGSARKWQTSEGKEEWGRAMHKIYLEQGGRDGYLDYDGSPILKANNMTADHSKAYKEDPEYWHQKALELDPNLTGNDLKIKAHELSDDPSNVVLTRFGFNKQPKNKRDIPGTVESQRRFTNARNPQREEARQADKEIGKQRSQSRLDNYYNPVMDELKKLITPLKRRDIREMQAQNPDFQSNVGDILMTPEIFEEIMENGQLGYDMISKYAERPDSAGKRPVFHERNVLTDVKRALLQSMPNTESVNSFAKDYMRSSDGAHDSGFNGMHDGHESRGVSTYKMLGSPYQDPGMDYLKESLARVSLFGGQNGKTMSRQTATRLKNAGRQLIGGNIGSGQFMQYIKDNLKAMRMAMNNDGQHNLPEIDDDTFNTHHQTLNRTIKNMFANRASNGEDDGDHPALSDTENDLRDIKSFPRPIFLENTQDDERESEFENQHSLMKALLSEDPNTHYNENDIYQGTILEKTIQLSFGKWIDSVL